MNGLRKLARDSKSGLRFSKIPTSRTESFNTFTASSTSETFECTISDVRSDSIRSFFDDGPVDESCSTQITHRLKLIHVHSKLPSTIEVKEDVFKTILDGIGLAPWVERLIHCWAYGYHHDVRITGTSVASHYLGTGHFTAMWATSQDGLACVTKGVVIAQENIVTLREGVRVPIGIAQRLFRTLKLFGDDSRSPFYLPFVLSVDVFIVREDALTRNFSTIRQIEFLTGHGTWGVGRVFQGQRDTIKDLTARLGSALNNIADIYKHLNIVELIWKELEALSPDLPDGKSHESVQASNKSIADAISILRQQSLQARDQAQYLEIRVRSQSSVLFSLLTHEDAKVSIQMANASVELAAAARRDGSSMKTIAVLTMAFLPATFFAAFFSIPSLGWTNSDKFPLFWACSLPVTLATFVLWAVVTQRKAVKGAVARLRRFARGRLGTGASSSDGSSLTTLGSSNASFEIEDAD